jgi:hypothetical protein
MDDYKLFGHDRTELSKVRRALHQWSKADVPAIMPVVDAIQQKYNSTFAS